MNPYRFLSLINQPEDLTSDSLADLQQITNYAPYCQIAQILYALNLKSVENIKYSEQYKLSVAYSGNRAKLKELIELNTGVQTNETMQVDLDPDLVVDSMSDDNINIIEQPNIDTSEEVKEVENSTIEDYSIPIVKVTDKWDEFKPDEVIEINKSDTTSEDAYINELKEILAKRLAEIAAENEIDAKEEAKQDDAQSVFEFVPTTYTISETEEDSSETTVISNQERIDKNELIERFLKSEPRITPRKEFFNPVDKSKLSNRDSDEIVTETLGMIHWKQGNYQKAIKIFEKLMLLNPEKSLYFAAQIKKIKDSTQI